MLRQPALSAIGAYQRYLSLHAIADFGMIKAIPRILLRFAQCKQASIALNIEEDENVATPRRGKKLAGTNIATLPTVVFAVVAKAALRTHRQIAHLIAAVFDLRITKGRYS